MCKCKLKQHFFPGTLAPCVTGLWFQLAHRLGTRDRNSQGSILHPAYHSSKRVASAILANKTPALQFRKRDSAQQWSPFHGSSPLVPGPGHGIGCFLSTGSSLIKEVLDQGLAALLVFSWFILGAFLNSLAWSQGLLVLGRLTGFVCFLGGLLLGPSGFGRCWVCTPWLQPALLRHCKLQQKCSSKLGMQATALSWWLRSLLVLSADFIFTLCISPKDFGETNPSEPPPFLPFLGWPVASGALLPCQGTRLRHSSGKGPMEIVRFKASAWKVVFPKIKSKPSCSFLDMFLNIFVFRLGLGFNWRTWDIKTMTVKSSRPKQSWTVLVVDVSKSKSLDSYIVFRALMSLVDWILVLGPIRSYMSPEAFTINIIGVPSIGWRPRRGWGHH